MAAEGQGGDFPRTMSTPVGEIKISWLPDGRYALRTDPNEALIEIVKKACKGKAQWNPRLRNWLVTEGKFPAVLAAIDM